MTQKPDTVFKDSLCLVDGSGYIFRAFYALPIMTRQDGTPVNAVYGFMNMMMSLAQENRCNHIAVVFDAKRKNYRNDIYPAYKENRKEPPAELIPQFSLIRQATDILNIPQVEMEGFEADDLIATYARIATEKGWHTTVISADKDLMQLMSDTVSIYDPMKHIMLTQDNVIKKFGVTADKMTDVQALMGDSVDNIPGATGIGPKGAADLINEFGSLEALLNNLDQVKNEKKRAILMRDKEQILISQQLVCLNSQAPVTQDLEAFAIKAPHIDKIESFIRENNFKSLFNKVAQWTGTQTKQVYKQANIIKNYTLITTLEQAKKALNDLAQCSCFAIYPVMDEAKNQLSGLAFAFGAGKAFYIPLSLEEVSFDLFSQTEKKGIYIKDLQKELSALFSQKNTLKIAYQLKELLHILHRYNIAFDVTLIADIRLMSYILKSSAMNHNLETLAETYLHITLQPHDTLFKNGKKTLSPQEINENDLKEFASQYVDCIFRLYEILQAQLATTKLKDLYTKLELPLLPILYEMENNGILVDKEHLRNLEKLFSEKIENLTQVIYTEAGETFNINSPMQLGNILFEKQGLSGGKKGAKGAYSTDSKVLEALAFEGNALAKFVLEYRALTKLKSTYVDTLLTQTDTQNRVHTTFMQTVTNTGRLSSIDPNLQNIPIRSQEGKEIRASFIAKKGYSLLCADYSQIELRLMADVAGIKNLKDSFLKNEDIHARTASEMFHLPLEEVTPDIRRKAKAINFGIIYGISAFGLANQLDISRTEAKEYIDSYFNQYPEIKTYMDKTTDFAQKNGFVMTPFGRRCYIQGFEDNRTKALAMRSAINAPIQGGAADIIKKAMIQVMQKLKETSLDASLLLQVHDELIFEVKNEDAEKLAALVKETMENVVHLSIPLISEIGIAQNWKEAH